MEGLEQVSVKNRSTDRTKEEIAMQEIFDSIPWAIIAPIVVLQLILMIVALVSCIRQEATNGPKWLWILLIIFVNLLGPILYFVIGRRQN